VYYNIPSNYTKDVQVQDVFAIETSGYEEIQVTVMLAELTDSMDRLKRNYYHI
jgi:hypothetical protein